MPYYVYILESLKEKHLYIGQTKNISERLERHNNGLVRATRLRRPLVLLLHEAYSTRSEAMRREIYLKSLKNPAYIRNKII